MRGTEVCVPFTQHHVGRWSRQTGEDLGEKRRGQLAGQQRRCRSLSSPPQLQRRRSLGRDWGGVSQVAAHSPLELHHSLDIDGTQPKLLDEAFIENHHVRFS
jgi:hypothetical protein